MNIGNLLKKIRKERNLTLKVVSDKLNISISTLSQYERNEIDIPTSKFFSLLDFYNINPLMLLKNGREYIDITDYSEINKKKVIEIDKIENINKLF